MIADWENSRFDIEEVRLGIMIRDTKNLGNYIFITVEEADKIIEQYQKAIKEIKKRK